MMDGSLNGAWDPVYNGQLHKQAVCVAKAAGLGGGLGWGGVSRWAVPLPPPRSAAPSCRHLFSLGAL